MGVEEWDGTCRRGDEDGDTVTVCTGDCAQGSANAFAGTTEVCNGVDDECDGAVDATGGASVCP